MLVLLTISNGPGGPMMWPCPLASSDSRSSGTATSLNSTLTSAPESLGSPVRAGQVVGQDPPQLELCHQIRQDDKLGQPGSCWDHLGFRSARLGQAVRLPRVVDQGAQLSAPALV